MSRRSNVSRDSEAMLPDGRWFESWERPAKHTRTYVVDGGSAAASDDNPGTAAAPFRTIGRAAEALRPGERVVIHGGVYRECVRPRRGGESPARMISYEAAPGESVVIRGSEEVRDGWKRTDAFGKPAGGKGVIWSKRLTADLVGAYNPFAVINLPRLAAQKCFDLNPDLLPKLLARRGLVFQNGRRFRQALSPQELCGQEGTYWAESSGETLHVRLLGDADPGEGGVEITTREQAFAPEAYELGYIRLKGVTVEQVADGFPWPQRAAVSTMRGHHWIIEDTTIRQVNAAGIDIGCSMVEMVPPRVKGYHVVRGNDIRECGVCGICGTGPLEGTIIEENRISDCGWHDVESYFECAGIKVHCYHNSLIRRNVIRGMTHAAGIWMDWTNKNSRCSRNVILHTDSMFGAIFVEASHVSNMVDNNFIWGSTHHGIYEHDTDRLVIAHNFIAETKGAAVYLNLGDPRRWVEGRGATAREHQVRNNIILNCASWIEFANPHNASDYNLFAGRSGPGPLRIHAPQENLHLEAWREFRGQDAHSKMPEMEALFDSETLTLTWAVTGEVPACPRVPGVTHDLSGCVRGRGRVAPGPFAAIPKKRERIRVGF